MKDSKILVTDFLAIDLENIRYKPLHSFLWVYKIGKWKPMPEILSVAVTKIKMAHSASYRQAFVSSGTTRHQTYCIFLRGKGANLRVNTGKLEEMREGAKIIGEFLNKPVVDYCKANQ